MGSELKIERANLSDVKEIWEIFQFAIASRKSEGSQQWQDGYPNENSIREDVQNLNGWIIKGENKILVYAAVIFEPEPAYANIQGKWLSNGEYVTLHRIAVSTEAKGKGIVQILFKEIEKLAILNKIHSIRVDTNYDNFAMLHILKKLEYTYCGEVLMRNSPRKAFEKILSQL